MPIRCLKAINVWFGPFNQNIWHKNNLWQNLHISSIFTKGNYVCWDKVLVKENFTKEAQIKNKRTTKTFSKGFLNTWFLIHPINWEWQMGEGKCTSKLKTVPKRDYIFLYYNPNSSWIKCTIIGFLYC